MSNSNSDTNSDSNSDTNKLFKEIADAYIDVGNQFMDKHNADLVGSSFLYGASRFSAFIVASGSSNLEQYKANRDAAVEHFSNQFKQMLEENLTSYEAAFTEEKNMRNMSTTPELKTQGLES